MSIDTRARVHALVDQLPPGQLAAVERLLQSIVDPVSRALANAPIEDEPFTEQDRRAFAEADEQENGDRDRSFSRIQELRELRCLSPFACLRLDPTARLVSPQFWLALVSLIDPDHSFAKTGVVLDNRDRRSAG